MVSRTRAGSDLHSILARDIHFHPGIDGRLGVIVHVTEIGSPTNHADENVDAFQAISGNLALDGFRPQCLELLSSSG